MSLSERIGTAAFESKAIGMAIGLRFRDGIEPEQVDRVLGALCRRRLAMELDGGYVVVGAVT